MILSSTLFFDVKETPQISTRAATSNQMKTMDGNIKGFYSNTVPGEGYQKDLEEAYNQIVYYHKNIFIVPTEEPLLKIYRWNL